MNKHSVITIIATIAIIIPFVYSGMNIYAAEQIKYRWDDPGNFSFFELSNNGNIEFCNAVPYNANFKDFQITMFYDAGNRGTYQVDNLSIEGSQSEIQKGKFTSENFVESQHLFMQMDFQFDGGDIRIDPRKMFVVVTIETPIIGIIPHTSTTQYTGFDFDKLMNQDFEC